MTKAGMSLKTRILKKAILIFILEAEGMTREKMVLNLFTTSLKGITIITETLSMESHFTQPESLTISTSIRK
jgi:hypothetical protein